MWRKPLGPDELSVSLHLKILFGGVGKGGGAVGGGGQLNLVIQMAGGVLRGVGGGTQGPGACCHRQMSFGVHTLTITVNNDFKRGYGRQRSI